MHFFQKLKSQWGWPAIGAGISFFLIGLITFMVDLPESEPIQKVGDYYVIEADFHTHSFISGSFPMPWEIVDMAARQKLDAVALVEHNSIIGGQMAEWYGRIFYPNVIVIPGMEVTTRQHHILVLDPTDTISAELPPTEVIRRAKAQGAATIVAHPARKFWPSYNKIRAEVDGVEAITAMARMNPPDPTVGNPDLTADRSSRERWDPRDLYDYWLSIAQERMAQGRPTPAATGNSDYHGFSFLGIVRTLVLAESPTKQSVLDALKAGRAVAWTGQKPFIGAQKYVTLLEQAGYTPSEGSYGYERPLAFNLLTLIGFGCLFYLVLIRPRRVKMNTEAASPVLAKAGK